MHVLKDILLSFGVLGWFAFFHYGGSYLGIWVGAALGADRASVAKRLRSFRGLNLTIDVVLTAVMSYVTLFTH